MKKLFRSLVVASVIAAIPAVLGAQSSRDRAAIREVEAEQAATWNRHDAAGYAALFTNDGDVVNVVGWWWKGQAEIQSKLSAGFAFVFKQSQMTIVDVQTRFLDPRTAIVHVHWTMTGAKTPPNIPEPRQGIQLQVLRKIRGHWLIASFQNTNSVPETPFPMGPPTASGH